MDLVGRRELFGDLVAGMPAAHHQHGPVGHVARPAVVVLCIWTKLTSSGSAMGGTRGV